MSHKSPNVPTPSPVHSLSQKVATAAKGKSSISFSNNLTRAIISELKILRTSKSFVLNVVVNTIVSALDENKGACSRVEASAFAIILLILLHARYSRQKERGLIIFTASLHHDTHKAHSLRTIENRKAIIGEVCILPLLSCFTNTHENVRIRRWVGIMLIQLLDNVDKNKLRFESCTEESRRALGNMLSEEQDELLRITCGELLRALMNWGINPEFLWPMGTNPQVYTNFPTSSPNEKHWNNTFQKYIDALVDDFGTSEGSGTLYFAQALVLTPTGNKIPGDIINILLDGDISICTQTSGDTFPESLEIPFDLIANANIEKTIWEDVGSSAASAVDLVVNLKPSENFVCYMNALPVQIGGFRITIANENDARNIAEEITEPKRYKKASQSKEVIAIGSELGRAASSKGVETEEGCNGERDIQHYDPDSLDWREEDQDEVEEVEFDNFIIQSPTCEKPKENDGLISTESGELIVEGITQATCNNPEDNASGFKPPTSSKTAASPHNPQNEPRTSVDKGKGREQVESPKDNISSFVNGGISSSPASPEIPSTEDLEEGCEPIADMSLPPVVPSQPKDPLESSQSKVKAKLKRIAPKSKAQSDLKRPKKYALKPKLAAPIAEAPPSKPVSAPRASGVKAPASNKLPKVLKTNAASASKPTQISKPKAIPKTGAGPSAKSSRKMASKSKASRRPASKKASKSPTLISPRDTSEQAMNPLENQLHSTNFDGQNAMNLEGATTVVPPSRHSQVLRDELLDNGEMQVVAHSRDLNQAGVINQPQQWAIQSENSRPYPIHEASSRMLDEAHSMAQNLPEQVGTLGYGSLSNKIEVQSESSPSSLSERLPIPLPPREVKISQPLISDAANNISKTVTEPTNIRRSPRSDAHFRDKEALAATNEFRTPARRPVHRQVSAKRSRNRSLPKTRELMDKSLSRGDEPALVDDRLARKPPLISFGAEGPRNQGIFNSKNPSLRIIRNKNEDERRDIGQASTQSHTALSPGKRKRCEMDASEFGKSKRQQTARLQKSNDKAQIMEQVPAVDFGNEDDHSLQRHYPLTQSKRKFGSRGSRVNANGSPRGCEETPKQLQAYEAVVRKALTHAKSPLYMAGGHVGNNSDYEGFKIVKSGLEITRNIPAKVSFELKPLPLLPPNEEVTDPRLTREKNPKIQISQVEAKEFYTRYDTMADPFLRPSQEGNQDSLSKSLQYHRQTPLRKPRDVQIAPIPRNAEQNTVADPEITLVDIENINPVQDYSSISDMTSESSDDNQTQTMDKTDLESFCQAEHDQWRMALKPHQKSILDVLNQISMDLVRHLINHEQAVDDVLAEYEQGGLKLMENINHSHQDNRRQVLLEFGNLVRSIGHEYGEARQVISRIIEALKARRVRELEKAWMQEQEQVQGLVDEGLKQSM